MCAVFSSWGLKTGRGIWESRSALPLETVAEPLGGSDGGIAYNPWNGNPSHSLTLLAVCPKLGLCPQVGDSFVLFFHQQFNLPSSQVPSLETSTTSWAKWSFQVTGELGLRVLHYGMLTFSWCGFTASTGALQTTDTSQALSKTLPSGLNTSGSSSPRTFLQVLLHSAGCVLSYPWMAFGTKANKAYCRKQKGFTVAEAQWKYVCF